MYNFAGMISWAVCNEACGDWDDSCFASNVGFTKACSKFKC